MKNQSVNYQELEFVIHPESDEQRKSGFVSKLEQLLRRIVESIIAVNELKIYSLKSRSGHCCWAVHDPLLGRKVFFESEAEVREWLDRRYYE